MQRARWHLEEVDEESYKKVLQRSPEFMQVHISLAQAWISCARELTQRTRADID